MVNAYDITAYIIYNLIFLIIVYMLFFMRLIPSNIINPYFVKPTFFIRWKNNL